MQFVKLSLSIVIVGGLFWLSNQNYLLFHSLVEVFSIVVAFMIFGFAWNSRAYTRNDFLVVRPAGRID